MAFFLNSLVIGKNASMRPRFLRRGNLEGLLAVEDDEELLQ